MVGMSPPPSNNHCLYILYIMLLKLFQYRRRSGTNLNSTGSAEIRHGIHDYNFYSLFSTHLSQRIYHMILGIFGHKYNFGQTFLYSFHCLFGTYSFFPGISQAFIRQHLANDLLCRLRTYAVYHFAKSVSIQTGRYQA